MGHKVLIWQLAFFTILWAIWRMENMIVFQNKTFDEMGYFDMCHFDLAWWVNVEWGEHILPMATIIRSPGCIDIPKKQKKNKVRWV